MKKATFIGEAFATALVLLALGACHGDVEQDAGLAASTPAIAPAIADAHQGLIYGRVTTDDGAVYEGRLRWGGDEEALWGNYFNGFKARNPWVSLAPSGQLPKEGGLSFELFGKEYALFEHRVNLGRPFMARFGDIARIEPRGKDLRVVLKSGTLFHLDRFAADDVADGVRVWDRGRGVVDIGEWRIRTIELLANPSTGDVPWALHGTVRTRQGDFTGFIQWDRQECLGPDELDGHTAGGEVGLRFDDIRSIARQSPNSSRVTLLDGREIVLSDTREVGNGNRGVYVDDPRYGRVLISWDAFERVDFSPGGTGPAYGDFSPGHVLTGSVVTRSGRHLAGRLVYDLDESETTETLDAPSQGVDYTIPFGLIASVVLPDLDERDAGRASVVLRSGEELHLELSGDLGKRNAGMLIFSDGRQRPEYVPWKDIRQVDLDHSPDTNTRR